MEELSQRKRVRIDSVEPAFGLDSSKAKRIRDDLLSLLDDSDTVQDCDSPSHDLDSVIRSFEEEIGSSGSRPSPEILIDLTVDSGDIPPELGEFSGADVVELAETKTDGGVTELAKISAELSGIGELWDFQDELAGYDSFGLWTGYEQNYESNDYVGLHGIFDYSDLNIGSDFLWRPDTLPAL